MRDADHRYGCKAGAPGGLPNPVAMDDVVSTVDQDGHNNAELCDAAIKPRVLGSFFTAGVPIGRLEACRRHVLDLQSGQEVITSSRKCLVISVSARCSVRRA